MCSWPSRVCASERPSTQTPCIPPLLQPVQFHCCTLPHCTSHARHRLGADPSPFFLRHGCLCTQQPELLQQQSRAGVPISGGHMHAWRPRPASTASPTSTWCAVKNAIKNTCYYGYDESYWQKSYDFMIDWASAYAHVRPLPHVSCTRPRSRTAASWTPACRRPCGSCGLRPPKRCARGLRICPILWGGNTRLSRHHTCRRAAPQPGRGSGAAPAHPEGRFRGASHAALIHRGCRRMQARRPSASRTATPARRLAARTPPLIPPRSRLPWPQPTPKPAPRRSRTTAPAATPRPGPLASPPSWSS